MERLLLRLDGATACAEVDGLTILLLEHVVVPPSKKKKMRVGVVKAIRRDRRPRKPARSSGSGSQRIVRIGSLRVAHRQRNSRHQGGCRAASAETLCCVCTTRSSRSSLRMPWRSVRPARNTTPSTARGSTNTPKKPRRRAKVNKVFTDTSSGNITSTDVIVRARLIYRIKLRPTGPELKCRLVAKGLEAPTTLSWL